MNFLVTICARGGSKGIPGKNIKKINGKPLICYTIDSAKKLAETYSAEIALSTDSSEIKKVALDYGLESSYERPKYLASDSAGKIDVINDVREYFENKKGVRYDFIIDLDVTSPLRTIDDITRGLKLLSENENAVNIFSVSDAKRNPYFNMVEQKDNGYFDVIKKRATILSRQKAPKVYDMNASFYIYKRKFFEKGYKSAITNASLVLKMEHLCFDLDDPVDFDFMEFLFNTGVIKL